ncbi:MAG: hypothetical protein ACOZBW_11425, partial [Thermodesulfobacteriota bacterium]
MNTKITKTWKNTKKFFQALPWPQDRPSENRSLSKYRDRNRDRDRNRKRLSARTKSGFVDTDSDTDTDLDDAFLHDSIFPVGYWIFNPIPPGTIFVNFVPFALRSGRPTEPAGCLNTKITKTWKNTKKFFQALPWPQDRPSENRSLSKYRDRDRDRDRKRLSARTKSGFVDTDSDTDPDFDFDDDAFLHDS